MRARRAPLGAGAAWAVALLAGCLQPSATVGDGGPPPADLALGDLTVVVIPVDLGPDGCGLPGWPCCPTNACEGAACCSGGRCVAEGALCGDAGTCKAGSCGGCGGVGEPCCAGHACSAPHTGCDGKVCIVCGAKAGDPCCADGPGFGGCAAGLACTAVGTCVPCGGADQPCCPGSRCRDGGCCWQLVGSDQCQPAVCSGGGSKCVNGSCGGGTCGAVGQPCCSFGLLGPTCTGPNAVCNGRRQGLCVACGRIGQPCCDGAGGGRACSVGACSDGTCR